MSEEQVLVRDELLDRLQTELVGPDHPEENIRIKPLQKYLCGILWPMRSSLSEQENEHDHTHGKETHKEEFESLVPLSKAMNPSSIGLSFIVHRDFPRVRLTYQFGMYVDLGDKEDWQRKPYQDEIEIDFSEKVGERVKNPISGCSSIVLEWISRPYGDGWAVSLFLVNRFIQEVDERDIDQKCVFQPKLILEGIDTSPFIVRRAFYNYEDTYQDSDTRSNDLLYRDETVFAVGHSIAVDWTGVSEDALRANKLCTNIIPFHQIPMVIPPKWDKGGTLDMQKLANCESGHQVRLALDPLCQEYEKWIKERIDEIQKLHPDYQTTAKAHMERCTDSLNRMKKGLDLLEDKYKPQILESFRFANKVMALQRIKTISAQAYMAPEVIETVWRPFQMAFILQNLEGLIDPTSVDRNFADLLWFPTGGGKTEAYLGLAALAIAYRRMRKVQGYRTDAGVSVIMRYTLRLLTIQQFQRAAAMICAAETVRLKNTSIFGTRPFRIGLWVGEKSVPNKFDDAAQTIDAIRSKLMGRKDVTIDPTKGSPVQLVSCPWCGHALYDEENPGAFLKSYKPIKSTRRILIGCPNKECDFHTSNNADGIPILVTDEEIYRLLPDMLIGTVDKFARMPWKPEVQNLFGKVKGEINQWGFISSGETSEETNHVKAVSGSLSISNLEPLHPPDLIIQDELHLISGPLGTMVGLYETAVDYLCSIDIDGKKIGPKVIASTATIRNANKQIEGLFTREARIFPSPGLSHTDSFFAKQRSLDQTPGRMYVGIFAPGRSMKTALLRIYANLLSSTIPMSEKYSEESIDPYHTLVGYFNSLRELGGAVRLIEDDVPSRMRALENVSQDKQRYEFKTREYERDVPELTSRIDSAEIPKILKKLEQPFYNKDNTNPIHVLLASNMISVGVDVARLGLMVVNGQPKTTAEYIQSTSRVGRTHPGLVLTLYNWIRPRDISHYEEFYAYHSAIYRYVEPISVTPFASRARDRGLAGSMISMLRLGDSDLTSNSSPNQFESEHVISQEIQEVIQKRVKYMKYPVEEVLSDLQNLYSTWESAIEKSQLVYSYSRKKEVSNLLYPLGQKKNGHYKIPNSMRDVESTAGIFLKGD
jgi:hypothetical protein